MYLVYSLFEYPYEGCSEPDIWGLVPTLEEAKAYVLAHAPDDKRYFWRDNLTHTDGTVFNWSYIRHSSSSNQMWYVEEVEWISPEPSPTTTTTCT